MKQVMNYNKDNGLLNMIRRTDPMINGHGLVYEMTRDPNAASHHYKNKQGNSYMFNGVEYYALIRYDSNEILKTQIDRVEEETKRNIHNRN